MTMINRDENIVKYFKDCGLSGVIRTISRLKMVKIRRCDIWVEP